jgi:hypothetical protein
MSHDNPDISSHDCNSSQFNTVSVRTTALTVYAAIEGSWFAHWNEGEAGALLARSWGIKSNDGAASKH